MSAFNKGEQLIGYEKINNIYLSIKEDLTRIGQIENTIQNGTISIIDDQSYSSFDELEIVISSDIQDYQKSNRILNIFKWMLIIFEALSGYLTIGLITHAIINLDSINEWVVIGIRFLLAIAFSFAIVTFAKNSIKSKANDETSYLNYFIAISAIVALPLFNVMMIYWTSFEVEYKQIYLFSLFFTSFTGLLLVLKSKETSKDEEKRISKLKNYKDLLMERKKKYSESRKKFKNIFKENNKYDGILENRDNDSSSNSVYSGLFDFLKECTDFDSWSINYIKSIKDSQTNLKSN